MSYLLPDEINEIIKNSFQFDAVFEIVNYLTSFSKENIQQNADFHIRIGKIKSQLAQNANSTIVHLSNLFQLKYSLIKSKFVINDKQEFVLGDEIENYFSILKNNFFYQTNSIDKFLLELNSWHGLHVCVNCNKNYSISIELSQNSVSDKVIKTSIYKLKSVLNALEIFTLDKRLEINRNQHEEFNIVKNKINQQWYEIQEQQNNMIQELRTPTQSEQPEINEYNDIEIVGIIKKIAWLYKLGITETMYNLSNKETEKAATLIASFTDIKQGTLRKCLDAIYKPIERPKENGGNQHNHPYNNLSNKTYVDNKFNELTKLRKGKNK